MIKEKERFDILSNIIQTTFGKSSQRGPFNIKMSVETDSLMRVTVRTLTSFGHDSVYRDMLPTWRKQCLDIMTEALKKAEKEYEEASKKFDQTPKTVKLKLKPETIEDGYELLNFSVYSPKKDISFYVKALVEIT